MSRLAKKPISIPEKVSVSLTPGLISVKGPLGELSIKVRPDVKISEEGNALSVLATNSSRQAKVLSGTYASHLKNMMSGVSKKYEKKLILEGVGYKSEVKSTNLVLALGFSHPVSVPIPQGLEVTAEKNLITIKGIDKELVGQFSAKIRDLKKPEPYKGKGFRYEAEVIRRKQGKKTV